MLTLNELRRKLGNLPENDERTPSHKKLVESGEQILAKHSVKSSEVTVYGNGFVLYRGETGATVFPFPKSMTYMYSSSCGTKTIAIEESDFDDMGWHFRLILEGEDRLSHNEDNRFYYKAISYSSISEEWKELKDSVGSAEDAYFGKVDRKTAIKAVDLLTDKQRYVVTKHFFNGIPYIEIAKDLGISRQAVRDMAEKALRRMRKHLDRDKKIFL